MKEGERGKDEVISCQKQTTTRTSKDNSVVIKGKREEKNTQYQSI